MNQEVRRTRKIPRCAQIRAGAIFEPLSSSALRPEEDSTGSIWYALPSPEIYRPERAAGKPVEAGKVKEKR